MSEGKFPNGSGLDESNLPSFEVRNLTIGLRNPSWVEVLSSFLWIFIPYAVKEVVSWITLPLSVLPFPPFPRYSDQRGKAWTPRSLRYGLFFNPLEHPLPRFFHEFFLAFSSHFDPCPFFSSMDFFLCVYRLTLSEVSPPLRVIRTQRSYPPFPSDFSSFLFRPF